MEVHGPMQIKIDTEILETIFTHATTAARLAGYLDDPIAVDGTIVIDEVVKSLEKIGRLVAERLGVATGQRGYQIHRRHRDPGTHPVARRRFFALTVPRRHAHELKFAVRTERSRA